MLDFIFLYKDYVAYFGFFISAIFMLKPYLYSDAVEEMKNIFNGATLFCKEGELVNKDFTIGWVFGAISLLILSL